MTSRKQYNNVFQLYRESKTYNYICVCVCVYIYIIKLPFKSRGCTKDIFSQVKIEFTTNRLSVKELQRIYFRKINISE